MLKAYLVGSYAHRKQKRKSGESYMVHPIAVATILAEHESGCGYIGGRPAARCGRRHRIYDCSISKSTLARAVAELVNGVTKLKRINELSKASRDQEQR